MSGSGKSALSEKLSEMGHHAYDIDAMPGLCTLVDTRTGKPAQDHDNADLEKVKNVEWLCDKRKLTDLIQSSPTDISFFCGAVSNADEIYPLFDKVILLVAREDLLRERLARRTSNDFARTSEVQEWLMPSKEKWENEVVARGAITIGADSDIETVAHAVIAAASKV